MLAYQCEQCPSMGAFYESSLDSLDPHSLPIFSTSKIVPFDAFFFPNGDRLHRTECLLELLELAKSSAQGQLGTDGRLSHSAGHFSQRYSHR